MCGAWRTGVLTTDAARLVVDTRILGDPVDVAAGRLGCSRKAAYERRRQAEARLAARRQPPVRRATSTAWKSLPGGASPMESGSTEDLLGQKDLLGVAACSTLLVLFWLATLAFTIT